LKSNLIIVKNATNYVCADSMQLPHPPMMELTGFQIA
jgi:hypothetical protein